jgi:hypothetical protein
MKCKDVESYMIDYLDNHLEKNQREEIEKHLEGCERCLDMIKDFKQILNTIESSEQEQPDESLRLNFYHMLHGEVNKLHHKKTRLYSAEGTKYMSKHFLRFAAGIALLIAGTFLGMFLNSALKRGDNKVQLTELKTEVQSMKELVILSMLKEESPSQRIQAVGYADEIQAPDKKVIEALITTLNRDKNVNVRLAAAYSLARYANRQSVSDSLVESLSKQTEPIIQVVLINILVEKRVNSAVKPIRKIISDENTLKDVKEVAQKGIEVLL